MRLDQAYNRQDFLSFLQEFLPDFNQLIQPVNTNNCKVIEEGESLGSSEDLELQILELKHGGTHQKRVSLANDGFRIMKDTGNFQALVVYQSNDDTGWRLSLMTATPTLNEGRVITKLSNPRRLSYALGPGSKVKTPAKFLKDKGRIKDFKDLSSRFSVEVVNNEFYKEIAKLYDELVGTDTIIGVLKHPDDTELQHEFAVRLIGRIIFAWFLREKTDGTNKPLVGKSLLSRQTASEENYYHSVLAPLFFEVLNSPINKRKARFQTGDFAEVPYLNGGLFTPQSNDNYQYDEGVGMSMLGIIDVPDAWLRKFFDLLELYNFTVDENTTVDIDLSIDPEMLGRIFENLLARINPETGETVRKSTGSFYTPREIVEYMVDESLIQYLITTTTVSEEKLRALVSYDLTDDVQHPLLAEEQKEVVTALNKMTVLDPACGSGAFPIGILQKVVFILQQIDPDAKLWFEKQISGASPEVRRHLQNEFDNKNYDYLRKLGIIRESIFGVDIQPIATEIARLRCFLTLIVDERVKDDEPNRGVEPLPNLDFKFVTANSLVPLPESNERQATLIEDKSSIEELKSLRDEYFTASISEKQQLQARFQAVQMKMLRWILDISKDRDQSRMTSALTDWDPFSHKSSKWFDSEWMFGITSGFDIVIANPPYVRNERIPQSDKTLLQSIFRTPFDQWSLYIVFFELALNLMNTDGIFCFISPNQWLSAKYGTKLRPMLADKVLSLTDFRNFADFENASVNTFITIGRSTPVELHANVIVYDEHGSTTQLHIDRGTFCDMADNLGATLSKDVVIINRIKNVIAGRFANHYKAGHSFSIPDFYNLSSIVKENASPSSNELKLVNTGTLSLLGNSWGNKKFKYNKTDYLYPVVSKSDFKAMFPSRVMQAGPKLIIASMGGLNIDIDINGEYLGTRPTMWLSAENRDDLKIAFAILGSKFINWFYGQQYSVAGMTGFKVRYGHIEETPLPEISVSRKKQLIEYVDGIIDTKTADPTADILAIESQIDHLVYKLYSLTPEEIKIIESQK